MKTLNITLFFILSCILMACNNQMVSDPANPKVNAEVSKKANFRVTITKVDEKKKKVTVKGIEDHKEAVILIDEKYYSMNNFKKSEVIDVWIDEHSTLTGNSPFVITNPEKIKFKH